MLVIEDEVLICMVIAQYLRDCGYKVIETADADEAVLVLQAPAIHVDVVIGDIDMPGTLDGSSLAKWVREHCPGIGVILAGTAPRATSAATELCEAGPLPKPYHPDTVASRIKRLLAARDRSK